LTTPDRPEQRPLQTALERRDIPFVLLTGYPRVLVRRHDHQNVLSKPVSPDLLCEADHDGLPLTAATITSH
jgi:hypothetical protein